MDLKSLYVDCPSNSVLFDVDSSISRQLFASFDDTLFAWTKNGLVAAVGVRVAGSETTMNEISTLFLTCRPLTPVLHMELNRSGSRLALICANSCYVVQIPLVFWNLKSSREKPQSEYLCGCKKLECRLPDDELRGKYLKVRWHPGSPNDKHLVVLCTDNVLRIYNVESGECPVQNIILSQVDSFAVLSPRAQTLRFSIGESAISFDFGVAVKLPHVSSKQVFYPIFVLYGNGDVYSVLTDVLHSRQFAISGPLTISPEAEDNYGVDLCDLLVLSAQDSDSAPLTVLVIASTYGNLYHAIVFQEDRDSISNENVGASFALHVYENVELEFSLTTVDLTTNELKDDSYDSDVCLVRDPSTSRRYFCLHGAGLHVVGLKWMQDLQRIAASDDADDQFMGYDNASVVDYRICTRPQAAHSSAPILGLAFNNNRTSDLALIVLLNDFRIQNVFLSSFSSMYESDVRINTISLGENGRAGGKREFFINHVKKSLQRHTTLPVLKAKGKEVSEVECAELLFRSVDVIKEEFVGKMINAHRLCSEMVSHLKSLRTIQEKEIDTLTRKVSTLNKVQSMLDERFEDSSAKQQNLIERLDSVGSALSDRSTGGIMSDAESKSYKEMLESRSKLEFVGEKLSRLNSNVSNAVNVVKKPPTTVNLKFDVSSLDAMQKHLDEQNRQIELLTETTKKLLRLCVDN